MMSEPRNQWNHQLKPQSTSPCARPGCVGWAMRVHAACHARVPYVTSYKAPAVAITEALEASALHKYHKDNDPHSGWSFSQHNAGITPSSVIKVWAE